MRWKATPQSGHSLRNITVRPNLFGLALLICASLAFTADASAQVQSDAGESDAGESDAGESELPESEPAESQPAYVVTASMEEEVDGFAARVGAAARAALRTLDVVDSRNADQAFLGYSDADREALAEGARLLEEGRQAYLELELEAAIERLEMSIAAFDRGAAAMEDTSGLGEALMYLGASQVFARRTRDARTTFQRLHVQMPQIQPDEDTFNPEVVSRYEASRPRDASAPSGSISIDSDPPGAIAYVDGVARGVTPLVVEELVAGEHVVRMSSPGSLSFIERTGVSRGRQAGPVSAFLMESEGLEGLAEAIANLPTDSAMSPERGGPTVLIGQILGVNTLGVIRVSPEDTDESVHLELLIFKLDDRIRTLRIHGPVPTAQGRLESGVMELVRQGFAAALRPQRQADAEEVAPAIDPELLARQDEEEDSVAGPIWTRWWLWAAIGGAVAAGVTVGILAAGGGEELGTDPTGTVVIEF